MILMLIVFSIGGFLSNCPGTNLILLQPLRSMLGFKEVIVIGLVCLLFTVEIGTNVDILDITQITEYTFRIMENISGTFYQAVNKNGDVFNLDINTLYSFVQYSQRTIKLLTFELTQLEDRITLLEQTIKTLTEQASKPQGQPSKFLGFAILVIGFGILIAGYILNLILCILIPKIFKYLLPQYYGIVLNWYRLGDDVVVEFLRKLAPQFPVLFTIIITGSISGMSSGIFADLITPLIT